MDLDDAVRLKQRPPFLVQMVAQAQLTACLRDGIGQERLQACKMAPPGRNTLIGISDPERIGRIDIENNLELLKGLVSLVPDGVLSANALTLSLLALDGEMSNALSRRSGGIDM
eukprot:13760573-Alexandrium_andersonii.AAC.1